MRKKPQELFRLAREALLRAVEHRRRDRQVAVLRVAVGHRLDVAVDAENLLDHHHRAARRASAFSAVRGQLVAVGRLQFDHAAHEPSSWKTSG